MQKDFKKYFSLFLVLVVVILIAVAGMGVFLYSKLDEIVALSFVLASKEVSQDTSQVKLLDGVYEIIGLLLIEEKFWESTTGPLSVPHFSLDVEYVGRIDNLNAELQGSESSKLKYERLGWDIIREGFHSVYGVGDNLEAFANRRVRIVGRVYDLCGDGWYLQDVNDSGIDCEASSAPDVYSDIELRNIVGSDLQSQSVKHQ